MIDKFLQYLQVVKNVSPHTLRAYTSDLTRFAEFVDPIIATKRDVRQYLASKNKKSVLRNLSALRSLYKYAILLHYL